MSFEDHEQVTDPRVLRALAHPVRQALLEALTREGPLTATQAAEIIGESPANCSFHLRTLAKYGFVEEAEGGQGRQRPWRRKSRPMNITEDGPTPESQIAATELIGILTERGATRLRTWHATSDSYPKQWRDAALENYTNIELTVDELRELGEQLSAVLRRYVDWSRNGDRPADAVPIHIQVNAFPLRPPRETPAGDAG